MDTGRQNSKKLRILFVIHAIYAISAKRKSTNCYAAFFQKAMKMDVILKEYEAKDIS